MKVSMEKMRGEVDKMREEVDKMRGEVDKMTGSCIIHQQEIHQQQEDHQVH